jgi:CRISPR-associated endonuclease/helicase Cas3
MVHRTPRAAADPQSPADLLAHAPSHTLAEHLYSVGEMAAERAGDRAATLARLAGRWHDLGKARPGFQRYVRSAAGDTAHLEGRIADLDKTHSAAGALWAAEQCPRLTTDSRQGLLLSRALQYAIAGHHAGLDDWLPSQNSTGLQTRLAGAAAERELSEARQGGLPEGLFAGSGDRLPSLDTQAIANERQSRRPGRYALHVRMLFSALVDADFLDTETYFDPHRAEGRHAPFKLSAYRPLLDAHLARISAADTPVQRARADVLAQCRQRAASPKGVFSLTVPTGGGKTLSSLAFALDHAAQHGHRRVVYAIPYTSIIEQTADVFRQVFAALGEDAVVEHHSNVEADPARETARSRLACENWDALLVVTTNVQLFESLFAHRASHCRKLHNLRDSVIVLDEAQLLPLAFLQPVVDALRELVADFGVTLLLCTATQPVLDAPPSAFDAQRGLRRGIGPVTEIVADVPALFDTLKRVQVHLPAGWSTARAWPEVASELALQGAVLAIVSRRADAAELYRQMVARTGAQGAWHLSALMCPQHRSDTLSAIREALVRRREATAAGVEAPPVRVVSTQLVEAGVDIDFPVVYRALAGLDSVAQAAGRCNREGRLAEPGAVHVFVPPSAAPPGTLRLARSTCLRVWHDHPADPLALHHVRRYFELLLLDTPSTDEHGIADLLCLQPDVTQWTLPVNFRSASQAFRLIDNDDAATVLVRYHSPRATADIDALLGRLQNEGPERWLMRKLQRYGVTVYRHSLRALLERGDVIEVATCPGLYLQTERAGTLYDPTLGLLVDVAPGDPSRYAL